MAGPLTTPAAWATPQPITDPVPRLDLDARPLVMGILNVTPDSFYDGGRHQAPADAVAHAERMIDAGADIIDTGGESTRPGARAVSAGEEIDRVLPVISELRRRDIPVSLDSSKPEVMRAALPEGVAMLNDVRALRVPGALAAAAASGLPVCLVHMQGEPEVMQQNPCYDDVVGEVQAFFRERIQACEAAGIPRRRLVLDPGFGFGKTPEHNLQLINRLGRFKEFGLPLLVGLSRKSTVGRITDDRLIGSVSAALAALNRGAGILRVHDVAETVAAVRVWRAFAEEQLPEAP